MLFILRFILFFQHKTTVVGETERGERQGYDEADEAQQGPPYGQGQEDDGGIEPGDVTHDARCQVHVLDGLHDGKDDESQQQDNPEVLSRLDAFHQGQDDGGDEANQLQIGHQIEKAYEQAQADGHRKVDDEETYREQNAHDEGYERLPTEVGIHAALHVFGQLGHKFALALWDELKPSVGDFLIVEQDEEHIEEDNEDREDAEYEAQRLVDEVPGLPQGVLQGIDDALLLDEFHDVVVVDEVGDNLFCLFCNAALPQIFLSHRGYVFAYFCHLADEGRNDEVQNTSQCSEHEDECHDDAQDAVAQPATELEKTNKGINHIGQQPCNEEGQQHGTQVLDEQPDADQQNDNRHRTYEAVKCNFPFSHIPNVFDNWTIYNWTIYNWTIYNWTIYNLCTI